MQTERGSNPEPRASEPHLDLAQLPTHNLKLSLEKRELIKHQKEKTTHFLPAVQRHGQVVLKRMERGGGGVD